MKQITGLSLALLVVATLSAAQGDERTATASLPVVLPLEYVNQHIYVNLTDEKLGALTLLVDTGWQRTTIDNKISAKGAVHGSFWKSKISIKGFGGNPPDHKYQAVAVTLRSGQTPIFATSAIVLDLAEMSKRFAHTIDGVLGWDFFRSSCVTLDFAARQMTVRNASQCPRPEGSHGILKGDWSSDGIRFSSVVVFPNGRNTKARLLLDTGSDGTIFLNPRFRTVSGLAPGSPAESEKTGWGMSGDYGRDVVPVTSLDLESGKLHFDGGRSTTITIGRDGSFDRLRKSDGVIGNGFLEKAVWTFDSAAKRVYAAHGAPRIP